MNIEEKHEQWKKDMVTGAIINMQKMFPFLAQKPSLKSIFIKEEYYQTCLDILNYFKADELTPRKAGVLFAIIVAIKEKTQPRLLNDDYYYSDHKLLQIFNSHLRTDFKQIKKNTKTFDNTKREVKTWLSQL